MTAPTSDGAALAQFAALLADRTRATFCLALLDGRAHTAGDLACAADVAASTATEHINHLVRAGLLRESREGRRRYVRLADDRAAQLIETLQTYATPARHSSLRAVNASEALRSGRTCYDHLAGRLGVAVTGALADRGYLVRDDRFALTAAGLEWLGELGIDVGSLGAARRPIARDCLDWTERQPHLAGSAAAAMCATFFDNAWIERIGKSRAVRVTAAGRDALHTHLSPALSPALSRPS